MFVIENRGDSPTFDKVILDDIDWNWSSEITSHEVKCRLENLNPNKASGCDGVNPYVLKECTSSMSVPLAIISKKTLETGMLPGIWRDANISPIFKKGTTTEALNYRPVSLTSIPCKVMEGFIRETITDHLKKHGFVKKRACVTHLLETLDILTSNLESENPVDMIYLDFAKAFDKVPQNIT